jgi:hypothetical protein
MFDSKTKANYKRKLIMRAVGSLEKLNADLALMPLSSLAF